MLAFLSGHRTYALAIVAAVLTFAHAMEWIGSDVFTTLMGLIGAGTAAALRAGIAKTDTKVDTTAAHIATVSHQVAQVDAKAQQAAMASTVAVQNQEAVLAAQGVAIRQLPDTGQR